MPYTWIWILSGFLVAILATPGFAQDEILVPEGDECATCHVDIDELPSDFSQFDVHFKGHLSCVGCHGGDATSDDEEYAMDEKAGFVGVPGKMDIPALCGKCHSDLNYMRTFQPGIRTDQEDQYHSSGHGKALVAGDTKVATCVDCHSAHSILPATDRRSTTHPLNVPSTCGTCHGDDAFMAGYGLHTGIVDGFALSVHGKALLEEEDLGSPACNDCHGNHGALPPEIGSLVEVCGTCHPNNQRFFEASPMAGPFEEDELHSCIECHGQHEIEKPTDEMVGVGENSVCLDCHAEGERGYEVADSIAWHLNLVVASMDSADALRAKVASVGMDDVDIEYLLRDAHQTIIQARTLVHTFDAGLVGEKTAEGLALTEQATTAAIGQLEEHSTRRWGFGLATIFISMLVVALYLKLRDITRDEADINTGVTHVDESKGGS